MQTGLLKWIDKMLGGVVAASLPAASARPMTRPEKILLIRPGGIGDAVLLIPVIRALKAKFPEAGITVLAERRNAGAFALWPSVDTLLNYDHSADLLRVIRGGFDLVIDTEQWHRLSAVVARLARAPVSIGFATNDRKRLFSHPIPYSHEEYELVSFFNLLAPLEIAPPSRPDYPFLIIPAVAARRADALLPAGAEPIVAIFPGASIPERRWGGERFRAVAEGLAGQGARVVVVGGPGDAADGDIIVRNAAGVNLAGKTNLVETAAVIARSAVLLSGDSGILHVGVGLGIPTVSLFGPGIEDKWGPKGEGHLVLNRHLTCSPCTRFGTTPPCSNGVPCLADITAGEVVSAVAELLKRQQG